MSLIFYHTIWKWILWIGGELLVKTSTMVGIWLRIGMARTSRGLKPCAPLRCAQGF